MEEGMDSVSNLASYSEYRREEVSSRTEICLLTKILNGMSLGLKRILGSRGSLDLNLFCLKLEGLLCAGGENDSSGNDECRTNVLRSDLVIVIYLVSLKNDLNALKIRAVVKIDESKRLGIAEVSYPTANSYALTAKSLGRCVNLSY